MCHIVPPDRREAIVVSITHVLVPRTMPLASAVIDYQKHRVKKLKKQSPAVRLLNHLNHIPASRLPGIFLNVVLNGRVLQPYIQQSSNRDDRASSHDGSVDRAAPGRTREEPRGGLNSSPPA